MQGQNSMFSINSMLIYNLSEKLVCIGVNDEKRLVCLSRSPALNGCSVLWHWSLELQ